MAVVEVEVGGDGVGVVGEGGEGGDGDGVLSAWCLVMSFSVHESRPPRRSRSRIYLRHIPAGPCIARHAYTYILLLRSEYELVQNRPTKDM